MNWLSGSMNRTGMLAVVDRAEAIRQGWLHRVALVSHRSFVPDAREAFDQYRVLREANRPSSY
ncbi:hypothetical protein [Streptomyces sp. Wh19]|uniref:Uncharacterized protein n=1 Tax=Streptomyces sanglieri TaxID=193460 RepID=A0ABW2XBR4_9ACTN|nr:hypothetical protein [Streptomyces sp. Wh19]MDV9195943.1 hypothetical protein [Streptomyces sp. Wh19]